MAERVDYPREIALSNAIVRPSILYSFPLSHVIFFFPTFFAELSIALVTTDDVIEHLVYGYNDLD